MSLDIQALHKLYRENPDGLMQVMTDVYRRVEDYPDPAVWISRVPWEKIKARVAELQAASKASQEMALFGIPFAVKDNLDVEGMDTTAACPGFAYRAKATAFAVAHLEAAGAILIGKTNMDQFATGLVGVRSPYGNVRNPFHAGYLS